MITSVVNSPGFRHSHFVSQKVKDAIADRFRDKNGFRPSVNTSAPEIIIHIHISHDQVSVSLDSSGDPLFKRGYRASSFEAPLNECLAAGMLMIAGWDGTGALIDPMCGSGTLPIEAALMAKKIPPGIFRDNYSFKYWKDFDADLFDRVKESVLSPVDFSGRIYASDISPEAVNLTRRNLKKAMLDDYVEVKRIALSEITPPEESGLIIMNPPYGQRLKEENMNDFYRETGNVLKRNFPGYQAWVLSANSRALKMLGLHPDQKTDLLNGSLKCKFQKYSLYQGSRKRE